MSDGEALPADLQQVLSLAGVTWHSAKLNLGVLKIRAQVVDFAAFAKRAGGLGDGKVRVAKNALSFSRQSQPIELSIIA